MTASAPWPAGWVARAFRGCDLFEGPVQDLIDELGKLPGIGPKSAQRIAFQPVERGATRHRPAHRGCWARCATGVKFCAVCGNVSDEDRCRICSDPRRDASLVCVVEEPKDVQAVERTREFRAAITYWAGLSIRYPVSGLSNCVSASYSTGLVSVSTAWMSRR